MAGKGRAVNTRVHWSGHAADNMGHASIATGYTVHNSLAYIATYIDVPIRSTVGPVRSMSSVAHITVPAIMTAMAPVSRTSTMTHTMSPAVKATVLPISMSSMAPIIFIVAPGSMATMTPVVP